MAAAAISADGAALELLFQSQYVVAIFWSDRPGVFALPHHLTPCDHDLPLANIASPTVFDFKRGELVFFRRFPVFFEQNPTLNRKKSFRCAKGRAFFFFSGRKKFFFEPKKG